MKDLQMSTVTDHLQLTSGGGGGGGVGVLCSQRI